jgi:hypothetical protein
VRLYWTGLGLPANIVEEYILLSIMLHVFVGIMRTKNLKLGKVEGKFTWPWRCSDNYQHVKSIFKTLYLFITGILLLTFMTIHLFQFRFGATEKYLLRPPPMMISWYGIPKLNLFWTQDTTVNPVPVRDIYKLEYHVFNTPGTDSHVWAYFYIASVCMFVLHYCFGWQNVVGVLGIPNKHKPNVEKIGYAIGIVLGAIYISFPVFCLLKKPFGGHEDQTPPFKDH